MAVVDGGSDDGDDGFGVKIAKNGSKGVKIKSEAKRKTPDLG